MAGIALLFACLATFIIVGVTVRGAGASILMTLAVCEGVLAVLPTFAAIRAGLGAAALGLRRPTPILVLAGILVGTTQWFVNLELNSLLPLPERTSDALREVAEQPPLAASLLVVAVLPALCEELLFRGVVNQSLATRWKPAAAVVISATLFSGYHMSVVQLLPTFLLGLVYGTLALRARSVIPTMIAHFLNNALALLVARDELPWLYAFVRDYEFLAFMIALAATAGGVALAVAFGGTERLPRAAVVPYGDRP